MLRIRLTKQLAQCDQQGAIRRGEDVHFNVEHQLECIHGGPT